MQGRMIVLFTKTVIPTVLLSFHIMSYGVVAYIPQTLRDYVSIVYEAAEKTGNANNLEELYSMIKENRILASDAMMRKAVNEILDVVKNNKNIFWYKHNKSVNRYLNAYLSSLNDKSLLLAMHGDKAQLTTWPISLVARSLQDSSTAWDMMCLSSELTSEHNMPLCGNAEIDSPSPYSFAVPAKENALRDSALPNRKYMDFNCDSDQADGGMVLPTIIFGTGAASPMINAWQMTPSNFFQCPVTMQFSILGHLKQKTSVVLELHFLVQQHAAPDGTGRIRVHGQYVHSNDPWKACDQDAGFSYIVDSHDFLVTEQLGTSNGLRHICVNISLEKPVLKNFNAACLSLTRITPTTGVEYAQDMYLVAAVLRYTV